MGCGVWCVDLCSVLLSPHSFHCVCCYSIVDCVVCFSVRGVSVVEWR